MNTSAPSLNETWSRREFLGTPLAASMAIAASRAATGSAQEEAGAAVAPPGNQRPLPFNPRTAAAMPMRNLRKTGFRAGKFEWVSLYNHSGQLDKVIGAPVPICDVVVRITPVSSVKRARLLKSGESLPVKTGAEGAVTCTVPVLNAYDVVLFEY